jgi:thiamine-monophosphate kinase
VAHLTIADVGENGLLEIIRAQLPPPPPGYSAPIHDVAQVPPPPPGTQTIITADMLVSGVHFDPSIIPPYYTGWRAMSANLSDIAAAGGEALAVIISLGLPSHTDVSYLTRLYRGMVGCLQASGSKAAIAGGDVVRSAVLTVALTVVGYAPSNRRMGRSGARAGDMLVVSGWTGRAAHGWQLLQNHQGWMDRESARRFLAPLPRLALGRELAALGATAMTDTSDSLYEGIANLASASGLGAEVWADRLPLPVTFSRTLDAVQSYDLAWGGGEDYELLAAIPAAKLPELPALAKSAAIPLTVIGRFTAGAGIAMLDDRGNRLPPPRFFHHF